MTLQQKDIGGEISHRLLRLNFIDVNGTMISYMDFTGDYPERIIVEKIKLFLEIVLSNMKPRT